MYTTVVPGGLGSDENASQDILVLASRYQDECERYHLEHARKATGYTNGHFWLGAALVISTALAGISSIGSVANVNSIPGLKYIIVISTLVSAVLAPLQTFLNPLGRGVNHQAAAASFDALKNQIDVFFLKYRTPQEVNRTEAIEELKKFVNVLAELKQNHPPI